MEGMITVIGAAYGTTAAGNDVTRIVQALVNKGTTGVKISNETLGGDPVPGIQKQFGIVYRLAGVVMARAANEGETIQLAGGKL